MDVDELTLDCQHKPTWYIIRTGQYTDIRLCKICYALVRDHVLGTMLRAAMETLGQNIRKPNIYSE